MIKVLYFAAIREQVGTAEDAVAADGVATVSDLLAHLRDRDAARAEALAESRRLLVAVNQEYADGDRPVQDGDEVALFPPVTGG